ncbi:hypothetical protein EDD15DRAFT_2432963 [Pisolithus albus]|nr:hypothetical protein EDD15DRAFT_2432963 [Pisolithus albus]
MLQYLRPLNKFALGSTDTDAYARHQASVSRATSWYQQTRTFYDPCSGLMCKPESHMTSLMSVAQRNACHLFLAKLTAPSLMQYVDPGVGCDVSDATSSGNRAEVLAFKSTQYTPPAPAHDTVGGLIQPSAFCRSFQDAIVELHFTMSRGGGLRETLSMVTTARDCVMCLDTRFLPTYFVNSVSSVIYQARFLQPVSALPEWLSKKGQSGERNMPRMSVLLTDAAATLQGGLVQSGGTTGGGGHQCLESGYRYQVANVTSDGVDSRQSVDT